MREMRSAGTHACKNLLRHCISTHTHTHTLHTHRLILTIFDSCVSPPADDMEAIPVKHFVKHIMELYKNNLQGFSEEFEVHFHHHFSDDSLWSIVDLCCLTNSAFTPEMSSAGFCNRKKG